MSLRIENLEALTRGKERLTSMRDSGARVINRAAVTLFRRLPPQAKRDIGKQYAISSREVGKRLHCKVDHTSVTLRGTGRPFTLTKFKGKQDVSGVTVQIEKGQPLHISHAFIRVPAGAPGAGPQVFIRDAVISALPEKVQDIATIAHDKHGYPITLLGGPSVGDMLRDPGREDRLADFGRQLFSTEVDRLTEVSRNG